MSDSEEDSYCYFGTALDLYDEDEFPKKKPISIEEQVATDSHGRRRFHGAFTGGFSAGFFNTVGSLEGWLPSDFKSSRDDKSEIRSQRPDDFMDDEDRGDFGIAPQTVRATSDYSNSKKRKKQVFTSGPIPGEPVLETLLRSGNETIGYYLIKNMNLKSKTKEALDTNQSKQKVYGCEMPKDFEPTDIDERPECVLPDIYQQHLLNPKSNTFGLGYTGLDKSHVNLFEKANLTVKERNNKKFSISGQAFGVGAFEDEDDDIYVKDNMNKYDFELTAESDIPKIQQVEQNSIFGCFVHSKQPLLNKEHFSLPVIPSSFTGIYKVRKSRFEAVREEVEPVPRNKMNASIRAKYLGKSESVTRTSLDNSNKSDPSSSKINQTNQRLNENDSDSINLNLEKEKQSVQANNFISDKFVSASQPDDSTYILKPVERSETVHGNKDLRDAARLKMFGPLTRMTVHWQPCAMLCKRFNVPEPNFSNDGSQKNKKRTKNLIFEYEKHVDDGVPLKPGLSVTTDNSTSLNSKSKDDAFELKPDCEYQSIDDTNSTTSVTAIEEKETVENIHSTYPDQSQKVDVSKNVDLFKAVFLSSSESESETTEETDSIVTNDMKINVVSEPLVPKIKPIREGILSNIVFSKFKNDTKTENKNTTETEKVPPVKESSSESSLGDSIYGPKLPLNVKVEPMVVSEPIVSCDDWIEKSSSEKQKLHKHKKKKSEDKHKKHKHKSKHKKNH